MNIHYIIHIPEELPGAISSWAKRNGHKESYTFQFEKTSYPTIGEFDMLVVMGGTMNIYEDYKYPWLKSEKQFIKDSIDAEKKVLGVCLGAQLVADVLGAKVKKNQFTEIGWFPVFKTEEGSNNSIVEPISNGQVLMHWHGDTFSIPEGAVRLFYSEACKNQAFIYNKNVLALQFHIELTKDLLGGLSDLGELPEGQFVQSPRQIIESEDLQHEAHQSLFKLLDNFTAKS